MQQETQQFNAPDMRQAIRQVREAFGRDALILESNQGPNGAHIVAAAPPTPVNKKTNRIAAPGVTTPSSSEPRTPEGLADIRSELKAMQSILQDQISDLAWDQYRRRQPLQANLAARLQRHGFDAALARRMAATVSREQDPERAWHNVLVELSRTLPISSQDLISNGGAAVFLGPPGAGKTTTVVKIAAQFALQHGPEDIAIIAADSFRIGGQLELQRFGQLLKVPVETVADAQQLAQALHKHRNTRLLLIDCGGVSHSKPRMDHLRALLEVSADIPRYLVCSASSQRSVIGQAIERLSGKPLTAAIITKLDETDRLGEAFGMLIEQRLPLAYVCDGPDVPHGIKRAQATSLIIQCAGCLDDAAGAPSQLMAQAAHG